MKDKLIDLEIQELLKTISGWNLIQEDGVKKLKKEFLFKNFAKAWEFTSKICHIAEEENHHPAIFLEWGKVTITWWTHKVSGLQKNDFIMAGKTDEEHKSLLIRAKKGKPFKSIAPYSVVGLIQKPETP